MKRTYVLYVLVCVVSASYAAEFHGLLTVPQWNERGNLIVEISNRSKLTISINRLIVIMPGGNDQACKLISDERIEVGPTQQRSVVLADHNRVQECLRKFPNLASTEQSTLKFIPISPEQLRGSTLTSSTSPARRAATMSVSANVEHRDQLFDVASYWTLIPVER